MDRHAFDKLYAASPRSAFRKALAGRLDASSVSFLRDHVDELSAEDVIRLFGKPRDDDDGDIEPFIIRLADALAQAKDHVAIQALDLAETLDQYAWADLTRRLRGRVPTPIWYFYVDRVRGGEIFNALNVSPPDLVDGDYLGPVASTRPEPFVVALLENPDDDLAARKKALAFPMDVILFLHERLRDHIPQDVVETAAASRTSSSDDRWHPPFPSWMATYVIERLRHCGDDEAKDLYEWLGTREADAVDHDHYGVARARLLQSPRDPTWQVIVGRHLATGKDWKKRGREFLEFYARHNGGFPRGLLTASLNAASAKDGATPDEHRAAILRTVHDESAVIFVQRAEEAMQQADWTTARQTLEALQSLDPGRFIRGPLHHLRKIPEVPRDVLAHVDACVELARVGGKEPSEEAFHDAFIALYGGLS